MSKKEISAPSLDDLARELKADIFYSLNCHRIGVIESFNPITQAASIRLVDKILIENYQDKKLLDFPLLIGCPVIIAKGAQGGLTYPINQGDTCLVLFNDRDIDNWITTGNTAVPDSARAHNLSDGIAILGLRNELNAIADYNNEETKLNYKESFISLDGNATKLMHNSGGALNLDDKIEIKNQLSDMKTTLNALIDALRAIAAIAVTGGTGTPIVGMVSAEIDLAAVEIDKLLK
tara:strand:- start:7153 stop:7857 length:705 start_codon:yes stop_codon:yes gene_type:complete